MSDQVTTSLPSIECDFGDSPLMFVIAHISFTHSPEIMKNIHQVKAELGGLGLPVADRKQQTTFSVKDQGPPAVKQNKFWSFTSLTRDRVVAVSANSLVVYDSNYCRFTDFRDRVAAIIGVLERVAQGGCFLTSVALRYISGFRVDSLPSSFLPPGLHGINAGNLATSHFHHDYRFWCDIRDGGRLTVIAKTVHGSDLVPKDIQSIGLAINSKFALNKNDDAVQLDIHEIIQTNSKGDVSPLSASIVCDTLAGARRRAKTAFLLVTTEVAHQQWKIMSK